jgi:diadenosine tetraphosphate (Ap4A) HIT family hydrolase
MAGIDHLWAGWRSAYLDSVTSGSARLQADADGTLFERILGSALPDAERFIVHRGLRCSSILNAYPYTNGHLLVLTNHAVADLDALDDDDTLALWLEVRDAVTAVRGAYGCDGVNVGMNLGHAAGAGVPDHLHVHVLPRWSGDTNFMTSIAETRVLPESLSDSWRRLRDAWPKADDAT